MSRWWPSILLSGASLFALQPGCGAEGSPPGERAQAGSPVGGSHEPVPVPSGLPAPALRERPRRPGPVSAPGRATVDPIYREPDGGGGAGGGGGGGGGGGEPVEAHEPELLFTDLSQVAALRPDLGGDNPRTLGAGGGVALFDADQDGDLDLLVTGELGAVRAYRNDGAFAFTEVTAAWGFGGLPYALALALGDCDADGDLDVFVSRAATAVLLRADGPGLFVDVSAESGVGAGEQLGAGSHFLDLDGDGDLDLLQLRYRTFADLALVPELPRVLLNDGGCRFSESPDALGLGRGLSLGAAAFDADGDGDLELAIANDFGMHHAASTLYENLGGRFEDVGARAGVEARIYGMGVGAGDFDNDLLPDFTFTNFFRDPFFRGLGGLSFHEEALARGVSNAWYLDLQQAPGAFRWFDPLSELESEREMARFVEDYAGDRPETVKSFMKVNWAAEPGDFDNDGRLDLFVSSGKIGATGNFPEGTYQPDALFRNEGAGFTDVAVECGLSDRGLGRGAMPADLDGDGLLDLVVWNAFRRDQPQPRHGVYRNETSWPGHHLFIELRGRVPNPFAVGARVIVEAGGVTRLRERTLGSSNFSAYGGPIHVGLGAAAVADVLLVRWPDGSQDRLTAVAADRTVTVVQGSAPWPPPP